MIDFMAMADDSSASSRSRSRSKKATPIKKILKPPVKLPPKDSKEALVEEKKAGPKKKVYFNAVAGNNLKEHQQLLTYKDVKDLERKIEEEKDIEFKKRVEEGTGDLDHEAIYKKLNAKSSPIKTGNNPYFNKGGRGGKSYGRGGKKNTEGAKPEGEKLDDFAQEMKKLRAEKNQNFQR